MTSSDCLEESANELAEKKVQLNASPSLHDTLADGGKSMKQGTRRLKELNPNHENPNSLIQKLGGCKQGSCLLYFSKWACLEDERANTTFQF